VQRCLRLILEEQQSIESILMVTFTEAAAAEMRARLRKEMEKARNALAQPDAIEEQLALLDTAHISTLHGFCLQLIREHFHELGLDPQVVVLDDTQTQPLIHKTLDAVLARCYERQVPGADAALALIRDYGGGSEEKIRGLILKLHRYTQTLPNPAGWMAREGARLATSEPPGWEALFIAAFQEWRREWLDEVRAYSEAPNVAASVAALTSCGAMPTFVAAGYAVRAVAAQFRQKWVHGTAGKFRDPIKKFFEEAEFLSSVLESENGQDALREDWNRMREPMRALLELTAAFTSEFTRAKRALGGVDFADLEQLALGCLLDAAGAPTETARQWQARFSHVFVDECQDINAAQDAIIGAVSRADSGNRFLVGDVKQSIYRFRLADPTIFRRYEDAWRDGVGGRRIPLADNFRSREPILNVVNALFTELMRNEIGGVHYGADAQLRFGDRTGRAALSAGQDTTRRVELQVIYKADAASGGPGGDEAEGGDGEGESEVVDLSAVQAEARLIAARLRELQQGGHEIWDAEEQRARPIEWRDMVVLLRSPGPRVESFAKEFARAGVPLSAARAGFFGALEVLDLISLLRLLDNPLQDIPLVAVLRSPLFGFSADELASIRIEAGGGGEFFAALNRFHFKARATDAAGQNIVASAREKVRRFRESFERWRSLVRHTSLSQCLEAALADTHFEAQLLAGERGRERAANVQRLLDLARNYDPFQRQGLYRFLRFVDEQQDAGLDQEVAGATEAGNTVRLMSIHRSKGLEFPVVAVGCLGAQFNQLDLRQDILLSPSLGLCARILCPESQRRYPSLPWWLARRREQRELLGEEMRLLYVAMTRARDTLLLTAFDGSKSGALPWPSGATTLPSDRELVSARGYWDWLRAWLGTVTQASDWSSERAGANSLLVWRRVPAGDLSGVAESVGMKATASDGDAASLDIEGLRLRLAWRNPWPAASTEAAKSNVTALRRRTTDDDEEAHVMFRPRRALLDGLSAADIGSAHHTFLQHVELHRACSLMELRNEAERMAAAGHLSRAEVDALNFNALLRFWLSPPGQRIVKARDKVQRELPFTARFAPDALRQIGIPTADVAPDDFIVVQGVIDLAVIHDNAIWLLDFKTDVFHSGHLEERVREYSPQLRLYASALARIYRRPVTEAALHFLSTGETLPISVK
jgi:ATP-dependent helicase/nuclease subunit A